MQYRQLFTLCKLIILLLVPASIWANTVPAAAAKSELPRAATVLKADVRPATGRAATLNDDAGAATKAFEITGIKINGDTCNASEALAFQATGTSSSPFFFWRFGDPASGTNDTITIAGGSANPFPLHRFSAPGIYTICVRFQEPGLPVAEICRTVRIGLCCSGPATTSTTNISICRNQLPYRWNGNTYTSAGNYTVTLVNAAGCDSIATLALAVKPTAVSDTTINFCFSPFVIPWNGTTYTTPGTYSITLTSAAGCDSIATLVLAPAPGITESTTTVSLCANQLPYSWNGNSYTAAGTYNVKLTNTSGCDSTATLILTTNAQNPTPFLGNDTSICAGQTITLTPGNFASYQWQDLSAAPSFTVRQTGIYRVTVTNAAGCTGSASISVVVAANCQDIFFPNSFSPNGDTRNDLFGATGNVIAARNYQLLIYNRWGQLVFSTRNPIERWNGTFKGKPVDAGSFSWYATYTLSGAGKRTKKGNLILIR